MDSNNQQISDDQELAKVLAGNNKKPQNKDLNKDLDNLQFEESPLPTPTVLPNNNPKPAPSVSSNSSAQNSPSSPATPAVQPSQQAAQGLNSKPSTSPSNAATLEAIKKEALEQLRPLAPKLNLPADEKFDTLLLIIRSTDDQSLLGAAHEAAKAIEDESRRAQALLDVIKEIDYFSSNTQQPTPAFK